jgi:hypothetical protein
VFFVCHFFLVHIFLNCGIIKEYFISNFYSMDNQNNNMNGAGQNMGGGLPPLQPLQPLQPTPVPQNKGFSFDAPVAPVKGEEILAANRVEVPMTPKPGAVSSSTLSSFSDFKPGNGFSTTNTQSSQSQLSSGPITASRFSKGKILAMVIIVVLCLIAVGVAFAYPKIKPMFQKLFAAKTVQVDNSQNISDQSTNQPTPTDQTITDQYQMSSSLDVATQPNVTPTPTPTFPKSGIGPDSPL